jgi:hypothetical protein
MQGVCRGRAQETGWGGAGWIAVARNGAQWRAVKLRVPEAAGKPSSGS